ncbi:hypothetical protein C8Q74DRAFT_1295867 [Fomes fomentarius]|nr:hypothetical protein C8Q74DRAFT_1295867 [Fomes fomentarius]
MSLQFISTLIWYLAIPLSTSSFLARAQASTKAICLPEFDWVCMLGFVKSSVNERCQMKNSKGQTPCLVTAWLSVPCQPEGFNVEGPLQNFTFYRGPDPTKDLLECQCNTVLYSTYAACAWCQGHTDNLGIANWTMFSQYCEDRKFSSYPQSLILPDTAIPAWAYAPLMVSCS